ncbi:polysaccharide deacetylase family protein [Peterkaempfera griseoplana]|uniref:polysaccharide deacetylase family protein n=1 Tax=Peterkaempfera griseoplana TaxID=66896 RepID=UPI00099F1549|nr:polysaccharide deacetylase family protein [Peterkaempfera griseoplana]
MAAEPLARDLRRPPARTGSRPHRTPWTLLYHSVDRGTQDPDPFTVTPERFAAQMRWLDRHGLRGVGMAELLRAAAGGRAAGLVGLTFDGGYADFLHGALPVLQSYGFTATVYVVADRLGGHSTWNPETPGRQLLTAGQVAAVADAGMEIGSHGMAHTALPGLTGEVLATETARSREVLRAVAGRPVEGFCYPYGEVDSRSLAAVRAAGYDYACAVGQSPLSGRHALPRCRVGDRDHGWRLHVKRARHLAQELRGAAARRRTLGVPAGVGGGLRPAG